MTESKLPVRGTASVDSPTKSTVLSTGGTLSVNPERNYDCAKIAFQKSPLDYHAQLSLAKAAVKLKKYSEALAILLTQLRQQIIDTSLTDDLLATLYDELNQNEKSIYHAKQAVEKAPTNGTFHYHLGQKFLAMGQFDEALIHFQRCIDLVSLPYAHVNLAFTLLAMGRYQEGWLAYESRFLTQSRNFQPYQLELPIWDGQIPIQGKKLIITWEQGIGDNIQFVRFIPLLKQRFQPKLSFVGNAICGRLFKQISGVDHFFFEEPAVIPMQDYQISLLSLPLILAINSEAQFFDEPYIHAEPRLSEKWRSLIPKNKLSIGLCWQGNSDYRFNSKRDCELSYFLSLLDYRDVSLVSLQKALSPSDREILQYSDIVNLGEVVDDFTDTAAIIANLDLVITVDTAIAHLAGAMGQPVWTLLRYETEWRHPRDRTVSPWYPSMRLFRQAKPGDWDSVFTQVHEALHALLA